MLAHTNKKVFRGRPCCTIVHYMLPHSNVSSGLSLLIQTYSDVQLGLSTLWNSGGHGHATQTTIQYQSAAQFHKGGGGVGV